MAWSESTRLLLERVGVGVSGLWSLIYAAQIGALQMALVHGVDGDLGYTQAGMDLGEALEELEWYDPSAAATAVDLGPVAGGQIEDYFQGVSDLLVGALGVSAQLIRDTDRVASEVLMLARVVHHLTSAHVRIVGRMP